MNAEAWSSETPYILGDPFFSSLTEAISRAKQSVEVEMYIFASDEVGALVAKSLSDAAKRGVEVRVIVDGVGSIGWASAFGESLAESGVKYKVYHPLPWEEKIGREIKEKRSGKILLGAFSRLNKRTHRKLAIVDGDIAFIGSRNITSVHSEKCQGEAVWNDVSVRVQGAAVQDLKEAFGRLWAGKVRGALRTKTQVQSFPDLVQLNDTLKGRRKKYFDLMQRISNATDRVWIVSSYFVPTRSLLKALESASCRGIDVRILVPYKSDVFFVPWVISSLQFGLLRAGVKVFEYFPSVLHAKYIIVDEWIVIGSSNLNHRSIFHDLEVDVVLKSKGAKEIITDKFKSDIELSGEVTFEVWSNKSIWRRALGRALLLFKNFL